MNDTRAMEEERKTKHREKPVGEWTRGDWIDEAHVQRDRRESAERERDERQDVIDRAHAAMHGSEYVGGPSQDEAWRTAYSELSKVVTEHQGTVLTQHPEGEPRYTNPDGTPYYPHGANRMTEHSATERGGERCNCADPRCDKHGDESEFDKGHRMGVARAASEVEQLKAACNRHTDEIIELLEALADIRTQASESFLYSHIHDTADIALLKIKRPAQVKDGE